MSSSPTDRTSTTDSSSSSPSPAEVAVIACGAIAAHLSEVVARNGWRVAVHPLPPLLHNHPETIAAAVEARYAELAPAYRRVAVGYADCGTYGALDELCARLGIARIAGNHCYDMFAGQERMARLFETEPGTYVLTDFLVRAFDRLVIQELGLDRYPDLRDSYFGNYTRVVWLAQRPTDELRALAAAAAERLGLPLETVLVGDVELEHALRELLEPALR
jgi:Protein of unknown function (DUF1638)